MSVEYITYVAQKKRGLISNYRPIETLFLGSSHGDWGINTQTLPGSYNLCTTSQDLHESELLYYYSNRIIPELRRVFVSYSSFSYALNTCESSEVFRSSILKLQFHILSEERNQKLDDYCTLFQGVDTPVTDDRFHAGFLQFRSPQPLPVEFTPIRRAEAHVKLCASEARSASSRHSSLYRLHDEIQVHGKQLGIIIPPMRQEYRDAMPSKERIFSPINQLCLELGIEILDLYDSSEFKPDDFIDADHLHPQGEGPKKMVLLVRDFFDI